MQAPDIQPTIAVHEDLLLQICAAPDADHRASMRNVDPAGWDALAQLAEDKRLCAIVLRAIEGADAREFLPESAIVRLEAARQWHAFYALKQMAAVKRLISVLGDGGFRPILLKGFGLAHGVYPNPALRPLRDVDVLLLPEEAARAQEHLLGHEAYRIAPWAGSYGMEFGHQLPEVQDVEHELTIEIHHRINARNWTHEALLLDLIRAEPTTLPVMGMDVLVPSPRTNFLHLLEHATLHHLFENGPLVLSDLHFLAKRHPTDWDWIESEAARMGLSRALTLVATLVREMGGDWVPARLSDPAGIGAANLMAAKLAMLQAREQSEQNKLLRRLNVRAGATGWRAALSRAVRPDPYELAKIGGCRHDQARRWLYYPNWIAQRGRRYLAATSDDGLLRVARQEAALLAWLEQGDSRV